MSELRPEDVPNDIVDLTWPFCVILSYLLFRTGILWVIHTGHGEHSWLVKDVLLTPARALGFGLCLAIMHREGSMSYWRWHTRLSKRGVVLLVLAVLGFCFQYAGQSSAYHFLFVELLQGFITTIPVVLFEETCFRGLIFGLLRRQHSPFGAAIISSALFAMFPLKMVPVSMWPGLFVYGFIACAAVELGTGLGWIALAHYVIDVTWLVVGSGTLPHNSTLEVVSVGVFGLAFIAGAVWLVSASRSYVESGSYVVMSWLT